MTLKARNILSYWLCQTSPCEESNWSDLCHLPKPEQIIVVGRGWGGKVGILTDQTGFQAHARVGGRGKGRSL